MSDHDDQLVPWCRAAIADGRLTLNAWNARLVRGGPTAMVLERLAETGVALADLLVEGAPGTRELFVRPVPGSPWTPRTDDAVAAWAHTVGYRRIWLTDRVVDLDGSPAASGIAETTCPTCGLSWRDGTPDFWARVRRAGAFPGFCLACGASLPEWRVADAGAPCAVSARHAASSASPCAGRRAVAP